MSQRWYEKDSVQAAMITLVGTIGVAVIGWYITYRTESHQPKQQNRLAEVLTHVDEARTQRDNARNKVELSNNKIWSAEGLGERVRLRGGLQLLTVAESELSSSKVPSRTYAFAHPNILEYGNGKLLRVPEYGRLSFEVQKPRDGVLDVVVFVNADEYSKLALNNKASSPVTLYSDFWDEAKNAILVDATSCNGKYRLVTLDDRSHISAVDCDPEAQASAKKQMHKP